MAWPMVAAIAVSTAISVGSSMANARAQAKANRASGDSAVKAAQFNADQTLAAGIYNADMTTAAHRANIAVMEAAARVGARDTLDISTYNAQLRQLIGNYNASLYDNEAALVYEAADVDINAIGSDLVKRKGEILSSFGASGAQINADDGMSAAYMDAATTAAINAMVVRRGADIQAGKLLNEAARSRWDGYVAAQQVLYEGEMSANAKLVNAGIDATNEAIQGTISSNATYENAKRSAESIRYGGAALGEQYKQKANTAMANGYYQSASAIASGIVSAVGTMK